MYDVGTEIEPPTNGDHEAIMGITLGPSDNHSIWLLVGERPT